MAFLAPLAEAAMGAGEAGAAAGAAEGGSLLGSRSGQFMLGQGAGGGRQSASKEQVSWSYPSNT